MTLLTPEKVNLKAKTKASKDDKGFLITINPGSQQQIFTAHKAKHKNNSTIQLRTPTPISQITDRTCGQEIRKKYQSLGH